MIRRIEPISIGTSCLLELIDPLEKDGFLQRFLETRREGPLVEIRQAGQVIRIPQGRLEALIQGLKDSR